MKQICTSDLHLGYEKTNYDKICKLFDLAKSKADKLILCGDTFDLWRYPVSKIDETTMVGFKETLNCLKETANEINTIIVPGNHDYNLSKTWPSLRIDYNVYIINNFQQKSICYTHGWEFDIIQRYGSFAYGWLVTKFPYIYQRFFKTPIEIELIKKDTLFGMNEKIHIEAEKFAVNNSLKYVVMGHTHIPTIFNNVINCGDFIDSCSYVVIENKKVEMRYI